MQFYFCGSIRGGREKASFYRLLISRLREHGPVLTEHVGDDQTIETEGQEMDDIQIHDRDLDWIKASDVVVAEVSVPSLGVGYEIGRAIEMGKPVLCLFDLRSGNALSAMIAGCSQVFLKNYRSDEEAISKLEELLAEMKNSS